SSRRRHTSFSRDWSSDVCSSDLIAWHLIEAAGLPRDRTRRVVFHEITRPAIQEAFARPRDIDMRLVDAQQARRVLDRLVGYGIRSEERRVGKEWGCRGTQGHEQG